MFIKSILSRDLKCEPADPRTQQPPLRPLVLVLPLRPVMLVAHLQAQSLQLQRHLNAAQIYSPRELQSQHGDISSKTCRSISSQRISQTPNFAQPLLTRACKYAAACALTAGLVLRKRATMAISKESKKAFLDQELDVQHGWTSMKWGLIETRFSRLNLTQQVDVLC